MRFVLFLAAVFHVTDQNGNKLTDESVIRYIEQVIITLNASFIAVLILIIMAFLLIKICFFVWLFC